MVVAKNDDSHRKLATQFARRQAKKTYIALVHGWLKQDRGTVASSISRDLMRRTRMTTRRSGGRESVTHYQVMRRLGTPFGKFTLLEVKIETGRTHQIRVHFSSLGHPVVGDTLYGAPEKLVSPMGKVAHRAGEPSQLLSLPRNFLHAAALELQHPRTGAPLAFSTPLPEELRQFMTLLEQEPG
jgi:23S rRNA pseudouridine1911/1915/1917 synthase